MAADELVAANRRLAGEESFTVAPSRYLGHYVAGHLASRLGIRIELQPGAAGGIVARVDDPRRRCSSTRPGGAEPMAMPAAPSPTPAGDVDRRRPPSPPAAVRPGAGDRIARHADPAAAAAPDDAGRARQRRPVRPMPTPVSER